MAQTTLLRRGWEKWRGHLRKPSGIAHLICCGGLLVWAAAFWSGFAAFGGAVLQPIAYAVGLLMIGAGIWLGAALAARRLREGKPGMQGK